VSRWPVGAPIVIAPTDWFPNEEDVATIAGVTPMGSGKYMLSLTQGLSFNHSGDPLGNTGRVWRLH